MKKTLVVVSLILLSLSAEGKMKTEEYIYKLDTTTFKGFLAYDDAIKGKRPGVLVVHEWWGLNDFARTQAENLAEMGYVAFAADMYGNGMNTTTPKSPAPWPVRYAARRDYAKGRVRVCRRFCARAR